MDGSGMKANEEGLGLSQTEKKGKTNTEKYFTAQSFLLDAIPRLCRFPHFPSFARYHQHQQHWQMFTIANVHMSLQ